MTNLQRMKDAFQNRVATDGTYHMKESDVEWLFSYIEEIEDKYKQEKELRIACEQKALHCSFHLRETQKVASTIFEGTDAYHNAMREMFQRQEIKNSLPDKYQTMFLFVLEKGWHIHKNEKEEIMIHLYGGRVIANDIEQFKQWLEKETNK